MTRGQLYSILVANGLQVELVGLADDVYSPVSDRWVAENYNAWLAARPAALKRTVFGAGGAMRRAPLWTAEANDCDNLALGVMIHGHVGNALAAVKSGQPRGGLAFGILFYTAQQTVRGGHAINWYVTHLGELRFFEPGTGEVVELTAAERASATFALAA